MDAYQNDIVENMLRVWVDEAFVSIPNGVECPEGLLESLTEMGLVVHISMQQLLGASKIPGRKQSVEKIGGSTVLTVGMNSITTGQALLKRVTDIVGGFVGCVFTGFLLLIFGPLTYLKSPGPIFFVQTRAGKSGKKFKMNNFRSMYLNAEARKEEMVEVSGHMERIMFKPEEDPRIIGSKVLPDGTYKKGIGNFIRDWSLDEFPQFFNVLKGDMSLVGTRPPTVDEWEKYGTYHRGRLAMKPGITGLWQVSGRSRVTDFDEVVKLDREYIESWSMGLDFRILFKTVGVMFRRDGAM